MRISDWSSDVCSSDLRLRERGHPFARVAERKTFINRDLDEMTVQLAVNAGPPATFGPLTFKGREAVEESYLRRLAEWPQGGTYDRSEEHTSELQSLMRISYAVFCLKKTTQRTSKDS